MDQQVVSLVGSWERVSNEPCSRVYPRTIEFQDTGLFAGAGAEPGDVPGWDRGTWEISGPAQVRISTLNDQVIAYEFRLSGDTLTFRDPRGCDFRYRRTGGAGTNDSPR